METLIEPDTSTMAEIEAARLIGIYKDLHRNPELGFMETRTAGIVAEELASLGFAVRTGIAGTGVAGVLANGRGPTVMYRADMDGNAVREATGLDYASTATARRTDSDGKEEVVPVGHLCGHDAHVTWLLGLAKAMAGSREAWQGTLVLIAQPAEELGRGAKAMVEDGLYEKGIPRPDFLLGMHTCPLPTGLVICKGGDVNAGTDQVDVTFQGVGGHGSSPHLAKDPVLMACAAVVQYQFIVSRGIDPLNAAVVTVGSIHAGNDNNVIPSSARIKANLRWYAEKDRATMLSAIERINRSIALAYDLPESLYPRLTWKSGSTVLSNDAEMADIVRPALQSLLGREAVQADFPKLMGSEDFHYLVLGNANPRYLFLYVGTANPGHCERARAEGRQFPYANHNPDYQVDLEAIPLGARIARQSVMALLAAQPG